jgi:hypothetical protein
VDQRGPDPLRARRKGDLDRTGDAAAACVSIAPLAIRCFT